MPIEDFTTQQVAEAMKRLETGAKALSKKKEGLNARLSKLSAQLREVDAEEKSLQRDIQRLETAKLLLREIPGGIRELRTKLFEARDNAVRDDVTVRQAAEFSRLVGDLGMALVEACPHPFVISHEGYKDYYSADRDESEPGERTCAICDLHEYEYSRWGGPAGFKALVPADHRLFASLIRGQYGDQRQALRATRDIRQIIEAFADKHILDLLAKMTQAPTE